MELSGLELRYLINEAKSKISSEYYVSDIIPVTESALLFKLHHSREPDIMLMISTQGLWITTTRFKTIEENPMVNILTREIERSKIVSLEQMGSERIFMVKFRRNDDRERILVVEIFGNGNMILCDAAMTILGLQRAIEVRHRTLRVGLKYVFPPKRGEDVFNMSLEHLLTSKHTVQSDESSVVKWLGTCTSMPKKFVDEVIRRSGIQPTATVNQLADIELQSIYTNIMEVVSDVVTGKNHDPAIL
ncbi:MAG: NFACT family protein, partial [Nitrososphaeraceae archaeon]